MLHSMTNFELIKYKLEMHPDFRERKTKGKYLAILAQRNIKKELNNPENLAEFAVEFETLNREWRNVLLKYPHLRGSDYTEKKKLTIKKRLSLGYGLEHA